MLDQNQCTIICADSYPPVCYDPCADQGSQGPKRNRCDGSRDVYCDKPVPVLPGNDRCKKYDDCGPQGGGNDSKKIERFSPYATIQASMISTDTNTENDAVADASDSDSDNDIDNDINISIEFGGCSPNFHAGDNVEGNQSNDDDTSDVKDSGNGNGKQNNNGNDRSKKGDGPKGDSSRGGDNHW